jgi:drug/metabolite transporter (DMT)-like permease
MGIVPETSVKSWLPLWFTISLTWGFSFLFIKIAGSFLDPFQQTTGRLGFGAITLAILVMLTKRKFYFDITILKHLTFLAVVGQVIPFTFFAWAEHYITSIAASLVNSMLALWTALLAILFLPEEKLNRTKTIGLLIGFVGIMILLGVWDANFRGNWLAYFVCILATICYAITSTYMRKFVTPLKLDAISAVSAQLGIGALILGIITLFVSSKPTNYPVDGVISILLLGAIGTGIAFAVNFELISRAGSVIGSTSAYAMPIVSTIAGVIFINEELHWYEPIGALVALTGIAMVQGLIFKANKKPS